MLKKIVTASACILVSMQIALAAYLEHGLSQRLNADARATCDKAFWYFIVHMILILVIASNLNHKIKKLLMVSFFIGALLFSGSLNAHAILNVSASLAPLGGSILIISWFVLGLYYLTNESN